MKEEYWFNEEMRTRFISEVQNLGKSGSVIAIANGIRRDRGYLGQVLNGKRNCGRTMMELLCIYAQVEQNDFFRMETN